MEAMGLAAEAGAPKAILAKIRPVTGRQYRTRWYCDINIEGRHFNSDTSRVLGRESTAN
jgi:hypothetical protein